MKNKLYLALAVALAALLCCGAFAADLTPTIVIDPAEFANNTYEIANLTFAENSDTEVTYDVYQQDFFDMEMVEALQAGDTITTGEGTITVTTVEFDEAGWCDINGGYENWGEGLTLMPAGGEYTTFGDDDYSTRSYQGTATATFADTVKFQHFVMGEEGLLDEYTDEDIPAAEMKAALEESGLEDYPMSVTVIDGRIEIIVISYCP